jgi:RND family efflux transporter MFP subunit
MNYGYTRAAIIAGLVLTFVGCNGGSADSVGTPGNSTNYTDNTPIAVRVMTPEYRTIENRLSYVGTVHARYEVPIASRTQGTLTERTRAEGEFFTRGTVLARLEAPELEAAVERLSAEADYWTQRHETDTSLAEQGALAPEQADSSERAARGARAALAEARAQLAKTVVEAPFDGQVLDWLAEPGQPLMPGQPIVVVGDPTREVRVDVVEEDLFRGISEGTSALLNLGTHVRPPGAGDESALVTSRVTAIAPGSSGPARTFRVTIPVPETENPRKGSSVRVHFVLDRSESSPAVPSRAITIRDGTPYLFVISDNTARMERVTTGVSAGGWTAVDFSWNGEDPVAVTNLSSLYDGAPVLAVREEGGR